MSSNTSLVDVTSMFQILSEKVTSSETNLRDKINNTNVDDQQSMMLLQMDVQRWTMVTQMESNVLKSLQDGIKNTVSNLR